MVEFSPLSGSEQNRRENGVEGGVSLETVTERLAGSKPGLLSLTSKTVTLTVAMAVRIVTG